MLTINLEKELSKQPVSKVNAKELLLIKEYDKLGEDVANSEVLERIGINKAVVQGKSVKDYNETLLKEATKFNTDKVYHVSQIKKLCNKYYLRFLPSALFKGNIDPCLTDKIATFEITYNVKCECKVSDSRFYYKEEEKNNNIFIAAPASSFSLQKKPKDPLLFYKINDEYYYLIHKWGNDLSVLRRFYKIFSSKILVWSLLFSIGGFVFSKVGNIGDVHPSVSSVLYFIACVIIAGLALANLIFTEGGTGFLPKNNIESRYI